jgi:hypothetical protein
MRFSLLPKQLFKPTHIPKMAPYQLTPEQLRIQAERKAAKEARQAAIAEGKVPAVIRSKEEVSKRKVLDRGWINVGQNIENGKKKCRIVSWNVGDFEL